MSEFEMLGLSPKTLKSVERIGFQDPTPIQQQAIPLVMQGHDIMGLAQTGTGKTAAFGLPIVDQLLQEYQAPHKKGVRALILAPTRELANQIAENIRKYIHNTPLRVGVIIGGASINKQVHTMHRGKDIVVATPGRLYDLIERNAVVLDGAKHLVLDEADQMLDLGFIHTLRKIVKYLPKDRQTLLFSATMPKQIEDLSRTYQSDPIRVETTPPGKAADKVAQQVHFVQARDKTDLLKELLIERRDDLSLVFARTKHGAEKLMKHLVACGFEAASIHGNKSQGQRDRAIKAFKAGEVRILVATDVAARGIDIPGVTHVYNFNLPEVPEAYVHRIGRTARAGAAGQAVAFCAPEEVKMLRGIEKLMGLQIEIASGEPGQYNASDTGRKKRSSGRRNPAKASTSRKQAGQTTDNNKDQLTERGNSSRKRRKPVDGGKAIPSRASEGKARKHRASSAGENASGANDQQKSKRRNFRKRGKPGFGKSSNGNTGQSSGNRKNRQKALA